MSFPFRTASAAVLLSLAAGAHAESPLLQPRSLVVDGSVPRAQAEAQILAARRYDTFWGTGEEALAKAALAPSFMDRTLPPGRDQGPDGPLVVSRRMRAAVPDLSCEIEQLLVVGDRVVTHLHFRGHFTGRFGDVQGRGQAIDFIATDIYRIANGRITDNWHLEDNLTLLGQMGLVRQEAAPSPEKKS